MILINYLHGKEVRFRLETFDYAKALQDPDLTKTLVRYDDNNQTVYIDSRHEDKMFYGKLAGIHECICVGCNRDLAPNTQDPNARCFLIDKMILSTICEPSRREEYIKSRIEMHKTLLDKKLAPQMAESCKYAIEEFEKLLN